MSRELAVPSVDDIAGGLPSSAAATRFQHALSGCQGAFARCRPSENCQTGWERCCVNGRFTRVRRRSRRAPSPEAWRGRTEGVAARRSTPLGHAEHTCHRGNRERGLVRAHEPEELDGSVPSPEQTRPRLLTEYRAPAAAACSHVAAGSTRHARPRTDQESPPPAGPGFGQPGPPRSEWSGRLAQTRGQDRQDYVQHGRGRPSDGETQANTVGAFWPSAAPLAKASGCPPNRVNPT